MFDRSTIGEGRLIQEFGLCDLKGVYQNTVKLRAKGWLVLVFFSLDDAYSAAVVNTLQAWSASVPADKVSIVGVLRGERGAINSFVEKNGITFPILWDLEDYVTGVFGINETPTTFVTDARGKVLAHIIGDEQTELTSAKADLDEAIAKAAAAAKAAADAAAAAAAAAPPAPGAPAPAPAAPAPAPVAAAPAPVAAPAATAVAEKEHKSGEKKKNGKK